MIKKKIQGEPFRILKIKKHTEDPKQNLSNKLILNFKIKISNSSNYLNALQNKNFIIIFTIHSHFQYF